MAIKEIILILAVMLSVLVLAGTGYAKASPPAEEWNRTYEMSGITSVESTRTLSITANINITFFSAILSTTRTPSDF
jgi:hypothetical protein